MSEVRLIDANALYREVKTECNPYGKPTIGFDDGKKVLKLIDAASTINAEPVRHGRWIETRYNPVGDTMYCDCNCSNCNFEITREKGRYPKFCENCGADMREDMKCDDR